MSGTSFETHCHNTKDSRLKAIFNAPLSTDDCMALFPLDIRGRGGVENLFLKNALVSFEWNNGQIRFTAGRKDQPDITDLMRVKDVTFKRYDQLTDEDVGMIAKINPMFPEYRRCDRIKIDADTVVTLIRFNPNEVFRVMPYGVASKTARHDRHFVH